ncbi:hypothetical protein C8J56DRAFT_18757 [Mycena floridula]|nr:hypothetical protein C8J56DRAFT_18757 [Mycena floridula]
MPSIFRMICFMMALLTSCLVASGPVGDRDVFVPPILSPKNNAVWKAGSVQTVSWNTRDAPKRITNSKGMIVLGKGKLMLEQYIIHPLAKDFNILNGKQNITVPRGLKPGKDYFIVVFGDSGNRSANITITG